MTFSEKFLQETIEIVRRLDHAAIEKLALLIADVRKQKGRIFFLGCGGGAGHAGHAVNDFRKIALIESYAITDNVSELTARINDEGWDSCFEEWLKISNLNDKDMLFVFSVGGGSTLHQLSVNIVRALDLAKKVGARIGGIVGRDGGATAELADACVIVPTVNEAHVTAHTESFQSLIWHLIISHPAVKKSPMRWAQTIKA